MLMKCQQGAAELLQLVAVVEGREGCVGEAMELGFDHRMGDLGMGMRGKGGAPGEECHRHCVPHSRSEREKGTGTAEIVELLLLQVSHP